MRTGQKLVPVTQETTEERIEQMNGVYTVIAIKRASLLEQQAGTGDQILAGPEAIAAVDCNTALVAFGAKHADVIAKAPAGLLVAEAKAGI